MKNKKLQTGFTLIELLAVMIILVVVGTIITSILVSTLRSGDKSTTTNDIRQNGNYAINQMSKMITYAKSFDGVNDGITWHTDCVAPPAPAPPLPSKYYSVRISSFDGGQTTFSCTTDFKLASGSASVPIDMIPPDTIIASPRCYFTCSQDNLSAPPTIGINLTLQKKPQPGFTLLPEAQTVINFQTSITLRNSALNN